MRSAPARANAVVDSSTAAFSSIQPNLASDSTTAALLDRDGSSSPASSHPMRRTRSPGCARAASGHVAAAPINLMNARRLRRGRDASYLAPPAQNRTCGFPAYGSHLGCVTANRSLGQGWRMFGFGSQSFASCVIRAQVIRSFWLRRRSVRRQRSMTWCRNTPSACALVGTA